MSKIQLRLGKRIVCLAQTQIRFAGIAQLHFQADDFSPGCRHTGLCGTLSSHLLFVLLARYALLRHKGFSTLKFSPTLGSRCLSGRQLRLGRGKLCFQPGILPLGLFAIKLRLLNG